MAKRGRKKSKNPKAYGFRFRTNREHWNRIRMLARMYAKGNLSKWLEHGGLNAPRKFLK